MEHYNIFFCRHKCLCYFCNHYIVYGQRFVEIPTSSTSLLVRLHIDCAIALGRELAEVDPLEALLVASK